jgi:hypothetical protein
LRFYIIIGDYVVGIIICLHNWLVIRIYGVLVFFIYIVKRDALTSLGAILYYDVELSQLKEVLDTVIRY